MAVLADVALGPLRFATIKEALVEQLGDPLETAGPVVRPGERRARAFRLVLPVHGLEGSADVYADGLRLRRQVRALSENSAARNQGLYFRWAADPEQDGWLLVGQADLEDAEGGITLAEWKLTLADCYRVGTVRSHRPARTLEAYDRRVATTPRDVLGRVFSTDFAASGALAVHALPAAAVDIVAGAVPVAAGARALIAGSVPILPGRRHREVVSFELPPPASPGDTPGDVLLLDRAAAATEAGWEQVFGPGQPLTADDVPVLENGLSRVRWVPSTRAFAVDVRAGGAWVEEGRVTVWRLDGPFQVGGASLGQLRSRQVRVVEWTPERAVVCVTTSQDSHRSELYLTLQRGWTAPRFELYLPADGMELRYTPAAAGEQFASLGQGIGNPAGTSNQDPWTVGQAWSPQNFATLSSVAEPTRPTAVLTVVQAGTVFQRRDDSTAYAAPRKAVAVSAALSSYLSMQLGYAPRTHLVEAEAAKSNSATAAIAADAAARGGQTVRDTQTTETNPTIVAAPPPPGRYGILVRVASSHSAMIRAFFGLDKTATVPIEIAATGYFWLNLGEHVVAGAESLTIHAWSLAVGGSVSIDAFALVPLELRPPHATSYAGARDHGQAALIDARQVPELVAR